MKNIKVLYISCYSLLIKRGKAANLTNVLYMCDSLSKKTKSLYMICFVPLLKIFSIKSTLTEIDKNLRVKIIPIPFIVDMKGIYSFFDLLSFLISLIFSFFGFKIYTRNLRLAKWLYIFKKNLYIEVHDFSKVSFECIARCKKAVFFPISKGLIKDINLNKLNRKLFLLPDAALLAEKLPCKNIIRFNKPSIGYIGSNNKGKGIKNIIKIAKLNPSFNYYLAGLFKIENIPSNIFLLGPLNKHEITEMLGKVDLLIAPYEKKVFDNKGTDISKYMSPLKIFEYMASKNLLLFQD